MANGDSERKVSRGQKWRDAFTAQWFNDVTEATRQYKRNRGNIGGSNGSSLIESNIQVLIQNGTDESLDEPYRIVRIDEALLDVTADPIGANTRPAFMGLVPDDANNPIAILQDGAKNQEFYSGSGSNPLVDLVPAVVSGVTICKVLMNDPDDMWANPVNGVTEYLESSENGQARILGYWEIDEESASTNIYWAFVNLIGYSNTIDIVDASHPDATPSVRGYVSIGPSEQVFGGPKKFQKQVQLERNLYIHNSGVPPIDGEYYLPFQMGVYGINGAGGLPAAPPLGMGFTNAGGLTPFIHSGAYVVDYDSNDDPVFNGTLDGSSNPQLVPIKINTGTVTTTQVPVPISHVLDSFVERMQPVSWVVSNGFVGFAYYITPRNYGYTNNGATGYMHSGEPPVVYHYADANDTDAWPVWEMDGLGKVEFGPYGDSDTLTIRVTISGVPKNVMFQGEDIGTLDGGSF